MYLKHFSILASQVSQSQVQWRKLSLTHSILSPWKADVEIFIQVGLESWRLKSIFQFYRFEKWKIRTKKKEGEEEGQEKTHTHWKEENPWQNQTHPPIAIFVNSPAKPHPPAKFFLLLLKNRTFHVYKRSTSTSTRASKSNVLDLSSFVKLEFKKLKMLVC